MASLAPAALAKGQTLGLDAPGPCPVQGDETLLAALVRNLVDNAIRYSPRGAQVQLALRSDGGGVTLAVDDSGPGLSEAELARLGERFFRVLGTEASGSGLGWSIVRRIAESHGAGLQVTRSAALGGLAVRVRFTAAPPDGPTEAA
jgi:two-component system sensor histidine kinase QseC